MRKATSHMIGQAASLTRTVHVAMTLTRSKVKVKVTGLLNFRKLASRTTEIWPFEFREISTLDEV